MSKLIQNALRCPDGTINIPHFSGDGSFIHLPVKDVSTHLLVELLESGNYDSVKCKMISDEIKFRKGEDCES